jgi:hypothetical protein
MTSEVRDVPRRCLRVRRMSAVPTAPTVEDLLPFFPADAETEAALRAAFG